MNPFALAVNAEHWLKAAYRMQFTKFMNIFFFYGHYTCQMAQMPGAKMFEKKKYTFLQVKY